MPLGGRAFQFRGEGTPASISVPLSSVLSNGAPGKQEGFQNEGFVHIRESTNSASNGCLRAVNFVSSLGAVDSPSLLYRSRCLFASILETARYLSFSVGWGASELDLLKIL